MPEPYHEKSMSCLSRNSNKISKICVIVVNLLFILAILGSALAKAIDPTLSVLSVPSAITLFFHWLLKYAPEKIEDCKKLLFEKLETEEDKEAVNKVYEEVLSVCERSTGRTQRTETAVDVEPEPTQRLPVRVVFNKKTGKMEYEAYDD